MLVFLTRLGLQLCGLPNCRCVRLVAGLPNVGFKSGLHLDDTIYVNSKAFFLIGLNDFLLVIFYPSYSSKFDFYPSMFPRVFQEEKGASLTSASNSTLRARQSLFLAVSFARNVTRSGGACSLEIWQFDETWNLIKFCKRVQKG